MSLWLRRGTEAFRWDGFDLFGRPPVVSPPAWALTARVWEAIGAGRDDPRFEGSASGEENAGREDSVGGLESLSGERPAQPQPRVEPEDWLDLLDAAVPKESRHLLLIVPDATRTGPWRALLPQIVSRLNRRAQFETAGSKRLLVAGGAHAVVSSERLRNHLGGADGFHPSLEGWELIQNGESKFRTHVAVGKTRAGTEIRLHPAYLEADHRIALGEVSYHYIAGFGGGPKLVFPGLGEPDAAARNHRLALRIPPEAWEQREAASLDGISWDPRCAPGVLRGNPMHEDLRAAVTLAPPAWYVTALEIPPLDPDPARPEPFPIRVVQGPAFDALEAAATNYDQLHRVRFTAPPRLLITDAGGEPRDANFLQAHKSLQHGARFLPAGGSLLLLARCSQGLGSTTLERYVAEGERFRPLASAGDNPLAMLHLQTLVALRQALGRVRVGLWSDLPPGTVRSLGIEPLATDEEARAWCRAVGRDQAWGWLPRAERFLPAAGWLGGGLDGGQEPAASS